MAAAKLPASRSGRSPREIAIEAAKESGRLLLASRSTERRIDSKGRGNLVSDADLLSERTILKLLTSEFPDLTVISEEGDKPTAVSDYAWIVDPLDGTNNFVFGIPFFCVNIALVHGKETVLGVTYDPNRDETFVAEKGKGAYLNGERMRVSRRSTLQSSLLGCDLGYDDSRGREVLDIMCSMWPGVHAFRLLGSSSLGLAYVACGRLDLYFHRFLYPWDIAPGVLLVNEAGGLITDWEEAPATYADTAVIASNGLINVEFQKIARALGE